MRKHSLILEGLKRINEGVIPFTLSEVKKFFTKSLKNLVKAIEVKVSKEIDDEKRVYVEFDVVCYKEDFNKKLINRTDSNLERYFRPLDNGMNSFGCGILDTKYELDVVKFSFYVQGKKDQKSGE